MVVIIINNHLTAREVKKIYIARFPRPCWACFSCNIFNLEKKMFAIVSPSGSNAKKNRQKAHFKVSLADFREWLFIKLPTPFKFTLYYKSDRENITFYKDSIFYWKFITHNWKDIYWKENIEEKEPNYLFLIFMIFLKYWDRT